MLRVYNLFIFNILKLVIKMYLHIYKSTHQNKRIKTFDDSPTDMIHLLIWEISNIISHKMLYYCTLKWLIN